jgi:hypothetical protein
MQIIHVLDAMFTKPNYPLSQQHILLGDLMKVKRQLRQLGLLKQKVRVLQFFLVLAWPELRQVLLKFSKRVLFLTLMFQNAFWTLYCDPHSMVAYDKLHFLSLGLWGHHTWPLLKAILDQYPKFVSAKVEERCVSDQIWM